MLCATSMSYAQADGIVALQSSDVEMTLNGVARGNVIASGSCGKSVNYELYGDYTLRIFGNGAMYDFNHADGEFSAAPWAKDKDIYEKIKAVVIENGVTRIGEYSFRVCTSLTAVTIPNSVTSIGQGAFSACYALTDITIPNSVTSIEWGAFSNCIALTKINIPNSVKFIKSGAFDSCISLAEVNLPNGLEKIEDRVFEYCSSLAHINIPNSVTIIEEDAFKRCSSLEEINIPNSVTSIGRGAFYYCDKLKYVKIGENVKEIDVLAFPQDDDEDLVIEITSETPAALRGADSFGFFCTIYVPESALETYRNAKYWKDHADQIMPKNYTTGISSIGCQQSEKETAIYDLQGHKVTEVQPHGIYIVNGKKVMK